MSTAIDLAVDVLAAHRLTRLAIEDEITDDLRKKWFEKHDPGKTKLGYLATCPWCLGLWVSFGVVAARRVAPDLWGPVGAALATSSAVGLLYQRTSGGW